MVYAGTKDHEWVDGPEIAGDVLMYVTLVTNEDCEDACGLGCHLKPCSCV